MSAAGEHRPTGVPLIRGGGDRGIPHPKVVVPGTGIDKAWPLLFSARASGSVRHRGGRGRRTSLRSAGILVILYTEGARPRGSEATGPPPLSPGNRSCIISTVHHRGSPSSRFTKWKQMNSIKHKPPELWFPFYLVVKEFIHNWHMIFSSGFKSFPNVKRNLSVWGGDGFVSNQSIMPSNGKEGGSPE